MRFNRGFAIGLLAAAAMLGAISAYAADGQTMIITGEDYTKWLWGNQHTDGSVYNFTTVPGEGYGDNGQGTEIDLYLASKPSKQVEVTARLQSRFNQNQWTNFGGFGGRNPALENPPAGDCLGGDCGEFDPRSNEYIKMRGLTAIYTPGFKWLSTATIGSNDLGMFDAFSIGKIRYIDRDNAKAVLFQGPLGSRRLTYDLIRISLPRLWAGPNFNTGSYTGQDGAYGLQLKLAASPMLDLTGVVERVRDIEVDGKDSNLDNGRDVKTRFRNDVYGLKFDAHPSSMFTLRGVYYHSEAESDPTLGAPASFFSISGFSPVPAGKLKDPLYKANLVFNNPSSSGPSFEVEYFNIGAQYVSMMAARRESDVLLTEGHDSAWVFPGPDNSAFGVFPNNPTRIGYGGWQGNAQQVATINVDNEFTDFEEPMAETVIGWKGITVVPTWSIGGVDLTAEYTHVDYNTNWQAWGDASRPIDQSIYPNHESDAGIGSYRNAYAPFQDRKTDIALLKGKYVLPNNVELFGKIKWIKETDKRMTDARFLPFKPGDRPGGGTACANNTNAYNAAGNSTAAIYGNPPVITVDGVTGYQWKPFDSLSDDDKDMKYNLFQLGTGYQFSSNLYSSLTYEYYDVDLKDGDTAFQAYQLHNMASGTSKKNKVMWYARYTLGGAEFGANLEYNFGTFTPDFGGGYVPQHASATVAQNFGVPVGSLGFTGRFGGWNSLEKRDFKQERLKVYMKVRF